VWGTFLCQSPVVSHLRQSRRLCLCEPLKAVLFKKFSDHLKVVYLSPNNVS